MKRLLAMMLVLVMAMGLVACGGGSAPAEQTPAAGEQPQNSEAVKEPVTLNVVTSYGGDDGNRKNFENAVKSFEEATGNKVNEAPQPPTRSGRPRFSPTLRPGPSLTCCSSSPTPTLNPSFPPAR